jgi:3(or 17)beta-hydroxysteroid dehydrogenase
MQRLASKIALITGGTQSIGAAIAGLFNQQGAQVIITGRKPVAEASAIANKIGANVSYLQLDVTKEQDWHAAMSYIQKEFGKLDILINNAGIEYPFDTIALQNPEHCSLADWQAVHHVNLDGIFLGCKFAIAMMKANLNSAIVNIGSRSGLVGVPSSAAYSSSKSAIRNYTKTVALYCANNHYPIRCNIIHPAAILTKMWDKEFGADEKTTQRIAEFSKNIPLKKMGTPEDIAYAALFLASDEAQFITGTELIVDGGIMAGSSASAAEQVIEVS